MGPIVIGDLTIDRGLRRVTLHDQEVSLSPTEYRLLCQLAALPGEIHTHQALLQSVWGERYIDQSEYLHVYIGRLRDKIEADPDNPRYFDTVHGIGYRLRDCD
jgi:two-component system, OmpR family, KDP operon response regulator KdpE